MTEEAEWNLHSVLDDSARDVIFRSKSLENTGARRMAPSEAEKKQCQAEMMKVR